MDGLSGAASGMAVVSLSFQLAASIKKLCEFWDSVQDAPDDIRAIVKELRLLSAVLEGIQSNEQRYGPDTTTASVLESCADKVRALVGLVDDLEPGFASTSRRLRKWSAFKATLRNEKIKKFRVSLEETKTTLMLARLNSSDRVTGINFDRMDTRLLEITQGVAGIQMQQSSRTVTTVSSGPADIDGHIDDLRAEARRIGRTWKIPILRSGFEMGLNNAYEGLERHLATQPSMKCHWRAHQTVVGEEKLPITEECDESSEESFAPALGKRRRLAPATKLPNRKRARVRYVVDQYISSTENVLGKIRFTTKTFHLGSQWSSDLDECTSSDQYEFETSFILHPAQWLLRCGVNIGVRVAVARSTQGWKQKLETYRAVPDHSLIFDYCWEGNLEAVRSLFSSGTASPHDTDSRGRTPLHFAASRDHLRLCKLLLDSGADSDARCVLPLSSPFGHYILHLRNQQPEDILAAVCLFNDSIDFSGEGGDGWYMLQSFCYDKRPDVVAWAFAYFLSDIKQYSHGNEIVNLLFTSSFLTNPASVRAVEAILNLKSDMVNATQTPNGHSALHNALSVTGDGSIIRALVVRGANLHLAGRLHFDAWNDSVETPTSLAMRQSYRFFQWRKVLIELGHDMEVFVKEELQQSPLVLAGWAEDTLLALFAYEFQPRDLRGKHKCMKCKLHFPENGLQEVWWEEMLEKIKSREGLNARSEVFQAPLWEGQRSCRFCHEPEENLYHKQGENFCRYCHEPGDNAYHRQGERVCIWCHQPGDNLYHSQCPAWWRKGERSCFHCEWKLHHPRASLLLDENWDGEQSPAEELSDEEYSPLHIHF